MVFAIQAANTAHPSAASGRRRVPRGSRHGLAQDRVMEVYPGLVAALETVNAVIIWRYYMITPAIKNSRRLHHGLAQHCCMNKRCLLHCQCQAFTLAHICTQSGEELNMLS